MHCASLRVIIPVPEVGDANESEGGAIVSVCVHTSGWYIDPKAPWWGSLFVVAFRSGALAVRWALSAEISGFAARARRSIGVT
jgi:hypothetical protein